MLLFAVVNWYEEFPALSLSDMRNFISLFALAFHKEHVHIRDTEMVLNVLNVGHNRELVDLMLPFPSLLEIGCLPLPRFPFFKMKQIIIWGLWDNFVESGTRYCVNEGHIIA